VNVYRVERQRGQRARIPCGGYFFEGYLLTTRHGAVALMQASLDHFEGFYKREKPHRKLTWL
jgi:hypothetical protein